MAVSHSNASAESRSIVQNAKLETGEGTVSSEMIPLYPSVPTKDILVILHAMVSNNTHLGHRCLFNPTNLFNNLGLILTPIFFTFHCEWYR